MPRLTKHQTRRKKDLLVILSCNDELIEWLQLELIDKTGIINYNANINADIIYGEHKGISEILNKLISEKENVAEED